MPLTITQVQGGQLALCDEGGNIIGVIDDAGSKLLKVATRLHDGSAFYTGAKETGGNLADIKTKTDNIPSDPAKESGKLTDIDSVLDTIYTRQADGNQKVKAVLYDASGNPVSVVLDGSVYRLQEQAKLINASGSYINPATEDTLALIKNTDGVKKITDALPTGDNRIGRVKITDDTNVAGVDAQNHQYVAGKSATGVAPSSNPVSISGVDGGGLKRIILLDTAGRPQENIAQWIGSTAPTVGQKGMASSIPVTMANDQTAIPVNIVGSSDVANLATDYLKTSGGSYNMKVNGSVTPVVFSYNADASKDIEVYELRFVFSAGSFNWSGIGFGKNAAAGLTTGILVEMRINNGTNITLNNIKINEDFLRTFGEVPVVDSAGSTVVMVSSYRFAPGSLYLKTGTTDFVKVTIRDDLTLGAMGVNYLAATFFGDKAI